MKKCKTCNQTKPLDEFYTHRKDCKDCVSKQYHANKILKGRPTHQPKQLPTEKTCRICGQTKPIIEFYISKPSQGRKSVKIETRCKNCCKDHYFNNKDVILAKAASKRIPKPKPPKKTVEETRARQTAYKRVKRQTDALFKLRSNVGTAIANSLSAKGHVKRRSTVEIIGCTFKELKEHIESQFLPGMSWDNRELWHIDHIVPQKLASTEEQVLLLNHYTNLRPLWRDENQQKSATITEAVKNHPLYTKLYTL